MTATTNALSTTLEALAAQVVEHNAELRGGEGREADENPEHREAMIDRILEVSLRQRAFVLLGAVALLGAGLWSALHLPIDAVPDITGVQVQVNTEVPALAAEESEKLVTQTIERELAGLPGVEEMRSITKFGLSQVTLQFKDGTDIYRARQLVAERLQGVLEQLPSGTLPKLAPISTGLGEILYYNVQYRADATNKPLTELDQLIELSEIQEYTIKPLLRTVPGIADINESGSYKKQYVIQPKPEALADVGMTFSELADIVAQNVANTGGGIINRGGQQLTIRAVSRVTSVEDIENLPLKFGAGVKPMLVKDVAEVKTGTKFRTGASTLNGHETVIGTAMMLAGENSREVAERVKARIAAIQTKPINTALAGQVVGRILSGNKRNDIVVRMPEELRADDEQIKKLPVRVGGTGLVPLGKLVEFETLKTVEPIQHDDGLRRAALMVNLKTRNIEAFVLEAERRIKEQVKLPENYIVQFGGQFENLQQARARLAIVMPTALALIFVLIFLAFGSLRQAGLVYSGIPLAVTGGVLALWLRGMPFSITAAVGFIALSGVAVLNGLVMIAYFNQLREEGKSLRDSVIEGSLTRLRPVIVTAFVASLGFVPMAIATGAGAEVQRPLATVVIGGILSSTFLTLVLLPVLYEWFERRSDDVRVATKEVPVAVVRGLPRLID